jgi:hypothetical protein
MKITEIKEKIQQLIDKAVIDNESQKKTLKFLFNKLEEVKESETIDHLRQFQGGNKYLTAYLTYKSIVRANYQVELTGHTNFDREQGQDKLLKVINADIELFIKDTEKREKLPAEQPTSKQLLIMLGERLAEQNGDKDEIKKAYYKDDERDDNLIKKTWDKGFPYLGV